jgi:hypothetical protein
MSDMPRKFSVKHPAFPLIGLSALLACMVVPAALSAAEGGKMTAAAPVDFGRDIKPILSENCFACHGFDPAQRKADLRLDTPEGAFKALKSGGKAVVANDTAASELMKRVIATNALRMPPASTGKKLSAEQIELLRRWIEQGARYAAHWAFTAPKQPPVPAVRNRAWPLNPIDRFILARLEKAGLKPSPVADRRTLIRRLTLDLTGLPPTPAEVEGFLGDPAPGAYERLVDRLLASPHYGERMALEWLDLARYADTHGYHIDSHRDMWPWRNWVIGAFNDNKPYDRFVVEQLAGDLLPNPTLDQKIATGFNRNHPINFEGGAIPEEYQTAYVLDRVDTTATAFMGLTMRCAQCHDHKYDPLTQREFYQFYAYFNNIAEQGLDGQRGNAAPFMKAPTAEQQAQLDSCDRQIAMLDEALKKTAASAAPSLAAWEQRAAGSASSVPAVSTGLVAHYGLDEAGGQLLDAAGRPAGTVRGAVNRAPGKFGTALTFDGSTHVDLDTTIDFERTSVFSYGAWVYPTSKEALTVLSRMDDSAGFRGWDLYLGDGKAFAHLISQWEGNALRVNTKQPLDLNRWSHLFVTYDGSSKAKGVRIYVNGKPADLDLTHDKLTGSIRASVPVRIGRRSLAAPFKGSIDEVRIYDRELSAAEVEQLAGFDAIRQILATDAVKRTPGQKETLAKFYLENADEPYRRMSAELSELRKKRTEVDNGIPTTMVMKELETSRPTHILIRGQYDKKGEAVTPGVPACLPAAPPGAPTNRLGLAQWLVDPSHPLTARVAVNRFWQRYFGTGLVRTTENFGVQADPPTHPELLDWLAVSFSRGSGSVPAWDIKAMQRLIVTSATYRQSSAATPELHARDPENRLLARAPRFRLPAELVRDQALAVSGLLVRKTGGPSVKPYQPPGLWEELAFGGDFTAQNYVQDHGEALYRRSMYTFWKRTSPPPSLQTFDAPEREFCIVRRSVTNTPLQALVLMNDPTYIEAARKFGERIMTEVTALPKDRIRYAYRLAMGRLPKNEEIRPLLEVYNRQLEVFRKEKDGAIKLLSVGESPRNEALDPAELAAWTSVCSVLFNLDEMITKN